MHKQSDIKCTSQSNMPFIGNE